MFTRTASPRFPIRLATLAAACLVLTLTGGAATPVITGFTPASGRPGTQVTINGSGFSDAAKVEFGLNREAAFVRLSASQLIAVVPDDGLTGALAVTPVSGSVGYSAGTFYVTPRIDSFNPLRGSTTTTITIDGANYISGAGNTIVRFGSLTSAVVNVTAPTQVRASMPAGVSRAIIYVSTFAGTATSLVEFVSTTLPVIESFTPENGLPGKNVPVVINGANLLSASSVKFNGVTSPFTPTADTQISTTIPASARTGRITITGPSGIGTSQVDFVVGPTIDTLLPFNPLAGKPGETVVIYGNDFSGLTNVSFNGTLAGPGIQTAQNQVQVTIPAGASSGKARVLTTNGEAISPIDFTIGPLVTELSKTNGPVGSDVTIYGAGFELNATQVKFGTIAATPYSYPANNQFIVKVPSGATNAPIAVATALGTNVTPYKFLITTTIPLVDEFDPAAGPQGTEIKIRGANFLGATAVSIGGVPVLNPQVTADSLIIATVPAGVFSGPVRVSNASGTGVSGQTYYAPPWTTSFSPASNVVGQVVTLRGTNFAGATDFYFGPEPGRIISLLNNEVILQVTTNARTGPITAIAPGGTFVTTNYFTVLPRLVDAQPRLGPVGTIVLLTGTSFFSVTNVAFNGEEATFTVLSPQSIQTTVPAGATSGTIRVATVDGESFSPVFTVTTPGDLMITETLSTNLIEPGQLVIYTSVVTNRGPSIQSGVTLTNAFPSGLVPQTATPSQGGCSINGQIVACALGVITNGRIASVVVAASPNISGVFTNTVSVRSVEGDLQNGDNTARNGLVVASVAERTLSLVLLSAPKRTVLSWPGSFVPFTMQSISELGNTNVNWQNVGTPPTLVNGTNRWTNANPAAAQEFYRLRYP